MRNTPNHADYFPPLWKTAVHTKGGATQFYRTDSGVELRVDVPGFDPEATDVRIQRSGLDRVLAISETRNDPYTGESLAVKLPYYLGVPMGHARLHNGVLRLKFTTIPVEDPQDIIVEGRA